VIARSLHLDKKQKNGDTATVQSETRTQQVHNLRNSLSSVFKEHIRRSKEGLSEYLSKRIYKCCYSFSS
jgi:hypothetical protein